MSERLGNDTVDLAARQKLITALTCFAMLSTTESHELASLMTEKKIQSG